MTVEPIMPHHRRTIGAHIGPTARGFCRAGRYWAQRARRGRVQGETMSSGSEDQPGPDQPGGQSARVSSARVSSASSPAGRPRPPGPYAASGGWPPLLRPVPTPKRAALAPNGGPTDEPAGDRRAVLCYRPGHRRSIRWHRRHRARCDIAEQIQASGEEGRGMAMTGLVLGIVGRSWRWCSSSSSWRRSIPPRRISTT